MLLICVLMVSSVAPLTVLSAPDVTRTQFLNTSDINSTKYNNVSGEIRLLGLEAELVSEDEPNGEKTKLTVLSDARSVQPTQVNVTKDGTILLNAPQTQNNQTKNPPNAAQATGAGSFLLANNYLLLVGLGCLGLRAAFDKTVA